MRRLCVRNLAFLCIGLTLVASNLSAQTAKPNILFIFSDDHAAHAIGAYGGRLAPLDPTPNLDRLAKEGALLTNVFCTNSICVPSRATVMTGQYSHRNGVRTLRGGIEADRQHLPKLLGAAGYETAVVGKWHLKNEPAAFDYYCVLPGQGSYFNPIFRVRGSEPWPKNTIRVAKYDCVHSSDAITDISLRWLRNRKKKGQPFFLMHQFKAPHDNFENAERYDWLYEDVDIPEPESLWDRGAHGPLGRNAYGTSVGPRNSRRNMGHHMFVDRSLAAKPYTRTAYQRYLKKYLRCVRGVDDGIGEAPRAPRPIRRARKHHHRVFLGPGLHARRARLHRQALDVRRVAPHAVHRALPKLDSGRHAKRCDHQHRGLCADVARDGGTRRTGVDAGSKLSPDAARRSRAHRLADRDVLPLLDAHGPPRQPGALRHPDARPQADLFLRTAARRRRSGEEADAAHWELYDLRKDPREMRNVYADPAYASTVAELKKELAALKERVGDSDAEYPALLERGKSTK